MQRAIRILVILFLWLALSVQGLAATNRVTLVVPGMICPTCPITLEKALKKVPGVEKIDVRFERKQLVVTYDNAKTSVQALVKTTTDAGYPSHEK